MRTCFLAILLFHCVTAAIAQPSYPKAVREQIARVENNFSEGMEIDGKYYSLLERMKHYNVNGLSISYTSCKSGLEELVFIVSMVNLLKEYINSAVSTVFSHSLQKNCQPCS